VTLLRRFLLLGAFAFPAARAAGEPPRITIRVLEVEAGTVLRAGQTTALRFPGTPYEADEMELVLSVDGGASFPIRVTRRLSPSARGFSWRVPNLPIARARIALRVGSKRSGEVIREMSGELRIVPDVHSPLEPVRASQGEWWTGPPHALDVVPPSEGAPDSAPAPGLEPVPEPGSRTFPLNLPKRE
jgi:hypothetical protein